MKNQASIAFVALTVAAVLVAAGWWLYDELAASDLPDGIVVGNGRLEVERVFVSSSVGGRVLRLAVDEGDRVSRGDIIAELDDRAPAAAVEEAAAAVEAATANRAAAERRIGALESELALAETEGRRYRELFAKDAAPRQAVDRAEAALERLASEVLAARSARDLAERQIGAARARRRAAQVQLDETRVQAPVSGTVDRVLTRAGELAVPGRPLLSLLENGSTKLRVYLPLEAAEQVLPGTEARVYLDAFPDRHFAGAVQRVAEEAEFTPRYVHLPDERGTLVFAVDVRISEQTRLLKDGFPADAYLRTDTAAAWPEGPPW